MTIKWFHFRAMRLHEAMLRRAPMISCFLDERFVVHLGGPPYGVTFFQSQRLLISGIYVSAYKESIHPRPVNRSRVFRYFWTLEVLRLVLTNKMVRDGQDCSTDVKEASVWSHSQSVVIRCFFAEFCRTILGYFATRWRWDCLERVSWASCVDPHQFCEKSKDLMSRILGCKNFRKHSQSEITFRSINYSS